MASTSITTCKQEIFDASNKRTNYLKKESTLFIADSLDQLFQVAGTPALQTPVLIEIPLPVSPANVIGIYTDSPITIQLVTNSAPAVTINTFMQFDTTGISHIFISNPQINIANVEIVALVSK